MNYLDQKYEINKSLAWQEIEGEILILDSNINEAAHDLNEMGSYIFQQILEGYKPREILIDIQKTYADECSQEQIESDFVNYLKKLAELQLIKQIEE